MSKAKAKTPRGPVIDVKVEPRHIDEAVPRDSGYCMIADAVRAAFPDVAPGKNAISVDLQTIRVTDAKRNLRYIYLTPRKAQEALVDFDQGIKPEPFSIRLRGAHVTRKAEISDAKRAAAKKGGLARAAKAATRLADGDNVPTRCGRPRAAIAKDPVGRGVLPPA